MISFSSILFLLVIIQFPMNGYSEKYCPWGGPPVENQVCSVDHGCRNPILVCTKWIIDTENMNDEESSACCYMFKPNQTRHCTETGMYSVSLKVGDNGYIWRWPPVFEIYRWYKKNVEVVGTKLDVVCPLPTPYSFYEYGQRAPIAVGFKIDGEPVPTCKTSEDCKEDEFCDGSTNPTFSAHEESKNVFLNVMAYDRSHLIKINRPMQFCFKNIDYGGRLIYVKGKNKTGPAYCDNNQDCKQLTQDPTYCHTEKRVRFVDTAFFSTVGGQCLRARICSKNNHTNEYGSLGAGGKFCDVNNPSTCPLLESMINSTVPITPVCVSAYESGNYKVSLCCYMVPEITTTTTTTTATTMDTVTESINSYSLYLHIYLIIIVPLLEINNV